MFDTCFHCGDPVDEDERLVLVQRKLHRVHCSEPCLHETVRKERALGVARLRRWVAGSLGVLVVVVSAMTLWHRFRAPPPASIASAAPEPLVEQLPPPKQFFYGPAWPPTDEQMSDLFDGASWVFPLPGPVRRPLTSDSRIFGPEPIKGPRPQCRKQDQCGVDLGGELWGEHVYAALDGVVDKVQAGGLDERGGQYIRIAHLGGIVFTHYFHLAAMPRSMVRGARVKAGDVIALLGDTGIAGARRHLHFTLSVHPYGNFPEVYWDPTPWLEKASMRSPVNGTVAGLAPPPEPDEKAPRRRRGR